MEKKHDLKKMLEQVQQYCDSGKRKELAGVLKDIKNNRKDLYHESIALQLEGAYSDALYKILLLELDEEEDESIELAELAYISLCSALRQRQDISPEHYKRRMLLLHYFNDYFTDSIIEVFLKKYRTDNLLLARNMAIECLEKMQLSDVFYLEDHHRDFIDRDEQLTDACNGIETSPDLSAEERENALLLHRVMEAYLTVKYKD